jgi:hypothetical protein
MIILLTDIPLEFWKIIEFLNFQTDQ